MEIAIIGTQGVGKTTLFDVMTRGKSSRGKGFIDHIGQVFIPDSRVDALARIYSPQKITYASFELFDFNGFGKMWKEQNAGEIINAMSGFDAFIHVVPDFEPFSAIDDFEEINLRLILSDLSLVTSQLERLEKERKVRKVSDELINVLKKLESALSNEIPLWRVDLSQHERDLIKGYTFATNRPRVILLNQSEEKFENGEVDSKLVAKLNDSKLEYLRTCLPLEQEIVDLDDTDRIEMFKAYGFERPTTDLLIQKIFSVLGYIVFLTAGEKEVRAWPIKKGSTAKEAAGKIHTDLARGFIRAEVINFEELMKFDGDMKKAKEHGAVRLEGRDYVVQDGDIMLIRFSR